MSRFRVLAFCQMRANAMFTKLPPDILFEIVAELKLDDAITFSQVWLISFGF